jgi:hypothetical protein
MSIWKSRLLAAALMGSLVTASGIAGAATSSVEQGPVTINSSMIVPVSGGCGPNGWRGPWGHCRYTPYYGPMPGGYYQERPVMNNGCPPGYWRGPWGHCRNTPYHGRLPDGGWK